MKSYPVFILITVAFFGLVLLWIAMARYDEFIRHNKAVASEATTGVADEIARFIINKQRLVKLFSQDLIYPVINRRNTHFFLNLYINTKHCIRDSIWLIFSKLVKQKNPPEWRGSLLIY